VWQQVLDHFGAGPGSPIIDNAAWLIGQTMDRVWGLLDWGLMGVVPAVARGRASSSLEYAGGIHDASMFFRLEARLCLGVNKPPELLKLRALIRLSEVCGWWWPFAGGVVLTDRPSILKLDPENRVHCPDGPAIGYPDGFEVYSWRGAAVPKAWITNKASLSAPIVLTWPNLEQRRAGIEILGWKAIIAELDPEILDTDPDPEIGQLLRCNLPGSPGSVFLKVRCGTKREFVLKAPDRCRTAREAQALLWSRKRIEDYNPEVRT
jgi:hypothetical protein